MVSMALSLGQPVMEPAGKQWRMRSMGWRVGLGVDWMVERRWKTLV